MSVNKNAIVRYQALDKCFSNPVKKCFPDVLLAACNDALLEADPNSKGIQLRQLYSDISFMESEAGYRVMLDRHKDGKKTYYRYVDPAFSINKQPINQAELEQVKSAMQILTRFKGMPQFEWVNELATKMELAFLLEKDSQPIISFDNNQYLKGIDYLGQLFHAILYKQVLCIHYQSFKRDEPKEYCIHPYYLKQYNNRWFLLGFDDELQKLVTFALDRIARIADKDIAYLPNSDWDFDDYFDDIIGVTRYENAGLQVIKMAFDIEAAPYVLSKPLHGSQKIISATESALTISIEVIPNYELQTLVLSHGDRVTVLEPQAFANIIHERLKRAAGLY